MPVLILGLLAFTVLWPLWFTVDGALMASDELTAALGPALLDTADGGYAVWTILPSWPTLQPLAELLLDIPQFFSVFWNTCLLAFAQIAGQLVVAAPASWAFAKLRFAGRRFLLLGYIALMVLPFQVLMVPNYLIATRLGIYDTPLSVILPGVFSAFPVFIMTRSFQDVPNELLEAAKLDGATAWQIFWKIGVPLGYAGIFAALVLNFIEGWNAVEQPLLFSAALTGSDWQVGKAELTIRLSETEYDCCLPVSALHSDNGGDFVYSVEERNTILGLQNIVRKVYVEVVERNNELAALRNYTTGAPVVAATTKSLQEGARVRTAG